MARTIKVRIAVAVDPKGRWSAYGVNNESDRTLMGIITETLEPGERRYWLEAELEVPELQIITVQPADAGEVSP